MALRELRGESVSGPSPHSSDSSAAPAQADPQSAFSSHSDAILESLADPEASLASVARQFNISLAALTLWLARPDIQARVREMESGACTHTRLAASCNLSAAVRVLLRILDDFDALARTHADAAARAADPDYIRASERARKAAHQLFRLSRVIPISESDLARAAAQRTASVNERISTDSQGRATGCEVGGPASANNPTPPSAGSRATGCEVGGPASVPDCSYPSVPAPLRPSAPSSPRSSDSSAPSAALRVETSSPSSSPDSPSVALRDLGGESSLPSPLPISHCPLPRSPRSSDSSAPSAFSSLDDLNAQLEQLAASLGIDTSGFDADAPLPPEFLALFPPDVAALLSHPPAPEPSPRESPPVLAA